jgi:hypothetical protein
MSGGLGALTQEWIMAEASRPLGWKVTGLVLTDGDDWIATARGPEDGQRAEARASYPEQAVHRLAEELRRIKGPMTG